MDTKYTPNSMKYREEQRQKEVVTPKKVVTAPVKLKKKSGFQKFADEFIVDDMTKIKDFLLHDVVIPSTKKVISDLITTTVSMLFYGDTRNRNTSNGPSSKVSYGGFFKNPQYGASAGFSSPTRTTYEYDNIVIEDKGEAEMVLHQMDDIIMAYGQVRVADLYEMLGKSGSYTDNNYGWKNLQSAYVQRVADGYLLKLPRVVPLT
jgi:hypothetical protein